MKKNLLLVACLCLSAFAIAQTGVSTSPQNRVVMLEEFTGINCPNCPPGHTLASNLLNSNPGQMFVVAYHPNNSNYTNPSAGQPDFRRAYPAAFYSTPYCGTSRFMPSAFIGREPGSNGEKITGTGGWTTAVNTIKTQPSPVNVGVAAVYNSLSNVLSITVQAYYTSTVTDANTIFVTLAENGIVGYQSNGSANYIHNHVFREAFTAQWGDPIANRTQGSMNTYTYTFTNVPNYVMANCEVSAFVYNSVTTKVTTGWQVPVTVTTGISAIDKNEFNMAITPNPSTETAFVNYTLEKSGKVLVELYNVLGEKAVSLVNEFQAAGEQRVAVNTNATKLNKGLYFVKLTSNGKSVAQKFVVE